MYLEKGSNPFSGGLMRMRTAIGLFLTLLAAAACHVPGAELGGRAADEWVRSYTLAPGGELSITTTNGGIEIDGYDGPTVEVRAERVVRAASDQTARDLVARIGIEEEVGADRVTLRSGGIRGLLIGVTYQVTFRVRAPHSIVARLQSTNGAISLRDFKGRVDARNTNGGIVGERLGGSLTARGTNGNVRVAFASIGADGVVIRTTNGRVDVSVPASTKANLEATCTNGTIRIDGLPFEPSGEQTRREARGTLNGGGPPIDLTTVNGGIQLRSATAAP
jgi:hypothetical protein